MARTSDVYLFPRGRLRPAMFGLADQAALIGAIEQYIADGTRRASDAAVPAPSVDTAVDAYVYWQAFDAAATLIATSPATSSIEGDESESFGPHQRSFLSAQAAQYRAAFEGFLPAAGTSVREAGVIATSVRTMIEW